MLVTASATGSTFAVSYGSGQVRALSTVQVAGTTLVLGDCDDGRVLVWHIDGSLVSAPVRDDTAGIRSMDMVQIVRPARPGTHHTGTDHTGTDPVRADQRRS